MSRAASTQPPVPGPQTRPLALPPFFEPPADFTRDGFFLVGTVVGRIRREFPGTDGKPTRYAITLAVQTERGQRIVLPVAVSFYQGKGGTGCRLTWGASARGEEF